MKHGKNLTSYPMAHSGPSHHLLCISQLGKPFTSWLLRALLRSKVPLVKTLLVEASSEKWARKLKSPPDFQAERRIHTHTHMKNSRALPGRDELLLETTFWGNKYDMTKVSFLIWNHFFWHNKFKKFLKTIAKPPNSSWALTDSIWLHF